MEDPEPSPPPSIEAETVWPDMDAERRQNECLIEIQAQRNHSPVSGLFCPGVFDGWKCWPDAEAGSVLNSTCPDFIVGFDSSRFAFKVCEANGSWSVHPATQKAWSNYTTCVDMGDLSNRIVILQIYEVGYLISLVGLMASLGIFFYFKSLRCCRTTIHINLFLSFAINNVLWLIWSRYTLQNHVLKENSVWCQIFHVILSYFLVTNYFWMLCEGLYLHTLLVHAFLSEERLIKWLFAIGWGLPVLVIVVYASVRANADPEDIKDCWMHETDHRQILTVPVLVSMSLNFVFLCNIVRVLFMKVRAGPFVGSQSPSRPTLQAARATFLLVPLLGLHYFLVPFRPNPGSQFELVYDCISAIAISFQGLCVAVLFCFLNGEVIAQFRRRYQFSVFRNRANSCTATTVSMVRSSAPTVGEDRV